MSYYLPPYMTQGHMVPNMGAQIHANSSAPNAMSTAQFNTPAVVQQPYPQTMQQPQNPHQQFHQQMQPKQNPTQPNFQFNPPLPSFVGHPAAASTIAPPNANYGLPPGIGANMGSYPPAPPQPQQTPVLPPVPPVPPPAAIAHQQFSNSMGGYPNTNPGSLNAAEIQQQKSQFFYVTPQPVPPPPVTSTPAASVAPPPPSLPPPASASKPPPPPSGPGNSGIETKGGSSATTCAEASGNESEPDSVMSALKKNPDYVKLGEEKSEINSKQKQFEEQYSKWENDFQDWLTSNVNHPDQAQLKKYSEEHESYRHKLLSIREELKLSLELVEQKEKQMIQNLSTDLSSNTRVNSAAISQHSSPNVISAAPLVIPQKAQSASTEADQINIPPPQDLPGNIAPRPEMHQSNVEFGGNYDFERKQNSDAIQEALEKKREADRLYQEALQEEGQKFDGLQNAHYQHSHQAIGNGYTSQTRNASQGVLGPGPQGFQDSSNAHCLQNRNEPLMAHNFEHGGSTGRFAHNRKPSDPMGMHQYNVGGLGPNPRHRFQPQPRPQTGVRQSLHNPVVSQAYSAVSRSRNPFVEDTSFIGTQSGGIMNQLGATSEFGNEQYDCDDQDQHSYLAGEPNEEFQAYPPTSGHKMPARQTLGSMRGPTHTPVRSGNPLSSNKSPSARFPAPRHAFPDFRGSESQYPYKDEWSEGLESDEGFGTSHTPQVAEAQATYAFPRDATRVTAARPASTGVRGFPSPAPPRPGVPARGIQRLATPGMNISRGRGMTRLHDKNFSDVSSFNNSNVEGDAFYSSEAEVSYYEQFSDPKYTDFSENIGPHNVNNSDSKPHSTSSVSTTNSTFTSKTSNSVTSKTQHESSENAQTEPLESGGYRIARNVAKVPVPVPKIGRVAETSSSQKNTEVARTEGTNSSTPIKVTRENSPSKIKPEILKPQEASNSEGSENVSAGKNSVDAGNDPDEGDGSSRVKDENPMDTKVSGLSGGLPEAADLDLDVIKAALKSLAPAEDEEDDIERQFKASEMRYQQQHQETAPRGRGGMILLRARGMSMRGQRVLMARGTGVPIPVNPQQVRPSGRGAFGSMIPMSARGIRGGGAPILMTPRGGVGVMRPSMGVMRHPGVLEVPEVPGPGGVLGVPGEILGNFQMAGGAGQVRPVRNMQTPVAVGPLLGNVPTRNEPNYCDEERYETDLEYRAWYDKFGKQYYAIHGPETEPEKEQELEWEREFPDQDHGPNPTHPYYPKWSAKFFGQKQEDPKIKNSLAIDLNTPTLNDLITLPTPTELTDVIELPGRRVRSKKVVLLLRGPPGSGKSFLARLIKEREIILGEDVGNSPRILSIDDFYLKELHKSALEDQGDEDLKISTLSSAPRNRVVQYKYEENMEEAYNICMLKCFKKSLDNDFFNFIIVDNVNHLVSDFEPYLQHAKLRSYKIYLVELKVPASLCFKRNVHKRSRKDVERIITTWEDAPEDCICLDATQFLAENAEPEADREKSNHSSSKVSSPHSDRRISLSPPRILDSRTISRSNRHDSNVIHLDSRSPTPPKRSMPDPLKNLSPGLFRSRDLSPRRLENMRRDPMNEFFPTQNEGVKIQTLISTRSPSPLRSVSKRKQIEISPRRENITSSASRGANTTASILDEYLARKRSRSRSPKRERTRHGSPPPATTSTSSRRDRHSDGYRDRERERDRERDHRDSRSSKYSKTSNSSSTHVNVITSLQDLSPIRSRSPSPINKHSTTSSSRQYRSRSRSRERHSKPKRR